MKSYKNLWAIDHIHMAAISVIKLNNAKSKHVGTVNMVYGIFYLSMTMKNLKNMFML